MRSFLLRFALLVGLVRAAGAAEALPNIVYILADDFGYGEVQALNPERNRVPTPHLDRLAREGIAFMDAHSGSAVCTPTRYGILTGRYAWRTRLQSGVLWGLSGPLIPPERLTVGGLLQRHGYATAAFGKWHLGMEWSGETSDAIEVDGVKVDYSQPIRQGPVARGFDTFFGISASLDMAPYVYVRDDRSQGAPTVRQTDWFRAGPAAPDFRAVDVLPDLNRAVVDYIENQAARARPFFVYYALPSPHTPIVVAPEWRGRSGLGDYADFVMQTDDAVGQVMAALERAGIAENTLIVFTSDNGCSAQPAGAEALQRAGHYPSGPLRGFKADLWEGGHRVPFIARWPARAKAGVTSDRTLTLNDLLATCADLVGFRLPDNAGEDSVSFLPTLLGQPQPDRSAVVHHSISGHFAIRDGRWKLLLAHGSGGWTSPTETQAIAAGLPAVQLYDLHEDLGERNNLAARHPEVVARLAALLGRHVAEGRSTPGSPQPNDVAVELWKTPVVPIQAPAATSPRP